MSSFLLPQPWISTGKGLTSAALLPPVPSRHPLPFPPHDGQDQLLISLALCYPRGGLRSHVTLTSSPLLPGANSFCLHVQGGSTVRSRVNPLPRVISKPTQGKITEKSERGKDFWKCILEHTNDWCVAIDWCSSPYPTGMNPPLSHSSGISIWFFLWSKSHLRFKIE